MDLKRVINGNYLWQDDDTLYVLIASPHPPSEVRFAIRLHRSSPLREQDVIRATLWSTSVISLLHAAEFSVWDWTIARYWDLPRDFNLERMLANPESFFVARSIT